ncbi:MAG: anthranilate phosphoribosyltransferase [Syntrophomonadaceae bacterium]|jgi:anthranilate phosphoribosyltransferase
MQCNSKEFGRSITHLINKQNLDPQQSKLLFTQVLLNQQSDMHQGAFLSALAAKGETAAEVAGIWEAIIDHDTCQVKPITDRPLVENCGTGMDTLQTFNISTAAAIVAAASGIIMARHGSRAITSTCGTIDLLEILGIDVEGPPQLAARSIEKIGIGIFNGMSPEVHQALGRILSQISFGSVLNIAASLANPARPEYAVRGVYDPAMIQPVAEVMRQIGYQRALILHGLDEQGQLGLDEASTLGETIIAELNPDGSISRYSIYPEDLGIKRAAPEAIAPLPDLKAEAVEFLKVMSGKEDGPRTDIVCLNAALIIYLMNPGSTLKQGYQRARELIDSGRALAKLQQWVEQQNRFPDKGVQQLNHWLSFLNDH